MSRSGGATLVETIVALILIYAGVVAVVGSFTVATRLTRGAERERRAVRAARQTLDSLSVFGYSGGGQRSDAQGHVEWTGVTAGDLATVTVRSFPPDTTAGPAYTVSGVVRSGS